MPLVGDLIKDPDFKKEMPEVQDEIFRRVASGDEEFQKLPKDAKEIIRSRLLGSSAGKAGTSHPISPYVVNQFKVGMAGMAGMAALPVDASRQIGQFVTQASDPAHPEIQTALDVKYDQPFKVTQNVVGAVSHALGAKPMPVPLDEYGRPSKSAEYLGKIAEFTGASLLPSSASVAMSARPLLAAGVEAGGAALSASSSVEGGELGKEYLPGRYGKEIGEFAGSLLGPGLLAKGAQLSGRGIGAGAAKVGISGGIAPEAQRNAGQALAITELRNSMYPDERTAAQTKANLEQAAQLQKDIPGFNPTLGQATGAPGVIALERNVSSKNAEVFAESQARKTSNELALQAFKEGKFPQADGSPMAAVALRFRGISASLLNAQNKIEDQIREYGARFDRSFNAEDGKRLDELYMQLRKNVKAQADQKYASVYKIADDAGLRIDMNDVGDMISKLKVSDPAAFDRDVIPGSFQEVVNRYTTKTKPGRDLVTTTGKKIRVEGAQSVPPEGASFQELHSLYKRTFRDYGRARDDQTKNYISQLQGMLKSKLDSFEKEGPVGEVMSNLTQEFKAANAFYRNNYASVFKEGLGGRIAEKSVFSDMMPDEQLVRSLIFKPDNETNMAQFFEIYGDNPEARQLLRNGVLDVFSRESGVLERGEVTRNAVSKFKAKYGRALDFVPEMNGVFDQIDATTTMLLNRRAEIQQQRKMLDKTIVADVAAKTGIRDEPEQILNKAIQDRRYMQALVMRGNMNETQRKALARSIADKVGEQKDPWQYLQDNAETIKPAMDMLGKDHWSNLQKLAQAKMIAERVPEVGSVGERTLQDIGTRLLGTPVRSIFSQGRAAAQGRQSRPYMLIDLGGKYIYKIKMEEADRVLREALYDTNLAAALAKVDVATPSAGANINLKHHLMAHGVRVLSATAADRYVNQ
jgi:uncharacterized protein YihD (DUF1040 family)